MQEKKEASERAEQQRGKEAEKVTTDKVIRSVAIGGIVILVLFLMIRGCGTITPKESETICDRSDAWLYAKGAVEDVLKNPDDADFHNPYSWKVEDDPKFTGQYLVTGEVTATNSFNAKLRQTFTAVVRCERGTWYTGKVTMR